jgi:hypothetical protein
MTVHATALKLANQQLIGPCVESKVDEGHIKPAKMPVHSEGILFEPVAGRHFSSRFPAEAQRKLIS